MTAPRRRRRRLVALLGASALAAGTGWVTAAHATGGSGPATGATSFTSPVDLTDSTGGSTASAEPSITVDSQGNVYASAPIGVPSGGCAFWSLHPDAVGKVATYQGTIDVNHNSVGGGDCDISMLPQGGGKPDALAVTSLSIANLTSNVSTDGGQSWNTVANPVSQQVFAVDRQWQASDVGLGIHYLLVHDVPTDNIQVSVSVDGGYQFVQNVPAISPTLYPGARINHYGRPVIDQKTHHIFVPFVTSAAGEVGTQHVVYVAEGDPCAVACPVGGPVGPITWTDHVVYTGTVGATFAHIFPAIAQDQAGRLYVVWTGATTAPATGHGGDSTNGIFLSHSLADATSWSPPVEVDDGTYRSNMFPWVNAGAPGQVGVTWYGATLNPTDPACSITPAEPTNDSSGVNNNCHNDWTVAYAQSSNADTITPTFGTSAVTGIVHHGSVCDAGTNCTVFGGDRTLLDFFQSSLDAAGRPNIAYTSDVVVAGRRDLHYVRQCAGQSLTRVVLTNCRPLGSTPVCTADAAYTDPAGDAVDFLGTPTPLPSEDGLDVVGGRLGTTSTGVRLTVDIKNLSASRYGQVVEQHFHFPTRSTTDYYVIAQKATGTAAITYNYGYTDPTLGRQQLGSTTGSWDLAKNQVSTDFPLTALTPPLSDGSTPGPTGSAAPTSPAATTAPAADVLAGLVVTTRRDFVALIPDADTATDPCSYTLGASANLATGTPTSTGTPSPTVSATPSPTVSATPSPTVSATPSPTVSATPSPTVSATPSPTVSATPSPTVSATASPTVSATPSPTVSATAPPTTTAPASSPSATAVSSPASSAPSSPAPASSPSATAVSSPASSAPSSPAAPATSTCPAIPHLEVLMPDFTAGDPVRVRLSGAPGEQVRVEAYSRPNTQYRVVRTVTLPADGAIDQTFHPTTNTRLRLNTTDCGLSNSDVAHVSPALALQARRTGQFRYTISGTVLPAGPTEGLRVRLSQVTSNGDSSLATSAIHNGRFSFAVTLRRSETLVVTSAQTMTSTLGRSDELVAGGR